MSLDHLLTVADRYRARKLAQRLQCRLDSVKVSKLKHVIAGMMPPGRFGEEMWNLRLATLLFEFSQFARTLPRPLRREWLYRLSLEASQYVPQVCKKYPLPISVKMSPGMVSCNKARARVSSAEVLDKQLYFLFYSLFIEKAIKGTAD